MSCYFFFLSNVFYAISYSVANSSGGAKLPYSHRFSGHILEAVYYTLTNEPEPCLIFNQIRGDETVKTFSKNCHI